MASRLVEDLNPHFIGIAEDFLDALEFAQIPYVVTCTRRDNVEQNELYAQGRTAPGKIVTNASAGQSPHNFGLAMDVYPLINGKLCTNSPEGDDVNDLIWQTFGKIARNCGLVWGGDWKMKDCPHCEHPRWKSVAGGQGI